MSSPETDIPLQDITRKEVVLLAGTVMGNILGIANGLSESENPSGIFLKGLGGMLVGISAAVIANGVMSGVELVSRSTVDQARYYAIRGRERFSAIANLRPSRTLESMRLEKHEHPAVAEAVRIIDIHKSSEPFRDGMKGMQSYINNVAVTVFKALNPYLADAMRNPEVRDYARKSISSSQ